MKHPYRIREIAAQAGLSEATVDRVLHQRGGVRDSTAREVHQAIADLDRQQSQARPAGRPFPIDVVVQAPQRFAAAVQEAAQASLPELRPAGVRFRFHTADSGTGLAALLAKIGRSRSRGLILQAPDRPEVADAVGRLGLPVVTLGTDLPSSKRVAYAGVDHADAGATAAYLIEQWMADRAGDVLVIRGPGTYRGEDEQEAGFRAEMLSRNPYRRLHGIVGDRPDAVHTRTRAVLAGNPSVRAVYSLHAGGNAAVVDAFAAEHRNYDVFVAYELDAGNTALLRTQKISAVLHHDLHADLRRAALTIMRAQGVPAGPAGDGRAGIAVITPFNTPAAGR